MQNNALAIIYFFFLRIRKRLVNIYILILIKFKINLYLFSVFRHLGGFELYFSTKKTKGLCLVIVKVCFSHSEEHRLITLRL